MSLRPFWVLVLLFHVACHGAPQTGEIASAVNAPRTCTKDESWLQQLIAQTLPGGPPACFVDSDCACGSYCNFYGTCEADCIATADPTYGCTGSLACDNWGQCVDQTAPPPATTTPAIQVSPSTVSVAGTDEALIDVGLDYAGSTGPSPTLTVEGTQLRVPHCADGTTTCTNPKIELVREIEVRCSASAAWADTCEVAGPWNWIPGGSGLVASAQIGVRAKPTAVASAWEVDVQGHGATSNDEAVTVTRAVATSQPFEGRYRGQLELGGRTLPIDAVARGSQLLLIDQTRTVSPSGKLPIAAAPATALFTWLGDADGELVAQLDVDSRTFDAATGALDARIRLTLPIGGDGRAGAAATKVLDGHVTLQRLGVNTATTCASTADCTGGTTCEPAVGLCLMGALWQSSTLRGPADGLTDPSVIAWSDAVRTKLASLLITTSTTPTPDAVERLGCYHPDWSSTERMNDVLSPLTILAQSGDLGCASGTLPWTARATTRYDASTGDADMTVRQLLLDCVQQLAVPVPSAVDSSTLATSSCISLARLIPGLDMSLDGALGPQTSNGRQATMAQELLRSWLEVAGFVMQQGEDDVGFASSVVLLDGTEAPPTVPLAQLLDRADATWKLVLHAPFTSALVSLDPLHLRAPDYRPHSAAAMYWPGSSSTDAAGDHDITYAPSCGSFGEANACEAYQTAILEPGDVDLSGDVTTTFHVALEDEKPYQNERLVVDHPELSVRLAFDGHPYREKGYTRSSPVFYYLSSPNWWDCHEKCAASGQCVAWTWEPVFGGGRCNVHDQLGTRVKQTDTGAAKYSGVVALASHQGEPTSDFTQHWLNTSIVGNDIRSTAATTFAACYDACSADGTCAAVTWNGSTCYLKKAVGSLLWSSGQQSAVMPTVSFKVAHLTTNGQTEQLLAKLPRTGLVYDTLAFDHRVTITRNTADQYYRVYTEAGLVGQVHYSKPPARWRGRFRVGRTDTITPDHPLPLFEATDEVAVWTTALDDTEIASIVNRCTPSPHTNCATRGALTLPQPASPDHDQPTGIAVTLLETLDRYHRLLERDATAIAGNAYAVCNGTAAASAVTAVEGDRVRLGEGLRRSLLVDQLATELVDRARQQSCESDSDCESGARCGSTASYRIDALSSAVTRGGTMQVCYGPGDPDSATWPTGLCSTSSTVVTSPGTVATATFTFNVAQGGSYGLWGKFHGASGQQSFWVRVDGGAWAQWTVGVSPTFRWHWSRNTTLPGGGVLQLSAGTHTVTLGVREGWTVVDELALTASYVNPPEQMHATCVASDGTPVQVTLPWQQKLDDARANANTSRQVLEKQVADLGRCEPPYGMTELDTPLFFTDPGPTAFERYFAASTYLMDPQTGRAWSAVTGAINDSATALQALEASRDAWYQQQVSTPTRLLEIKAKYDSQLGLLCGTAEYDGLFDAIRSGRIPQAVCFVQQTQSCLANAQKPVREANAACYGGELGEALMAIKAATLDVKAARQDWKARQNELDRKGRYCAGLEATGAMITEHNAYMDKLRSKKQIFDEIANEVGLIASVASGDPADAFANFISGMAGMGKDFTSEAIQGEQDAWDELMAAHANALDVEQCWDEASALRDQINIAQTRIESATNQLELAMMRFRNARHEVAGTVESGTAEVDREQVRNVAQPQHHDWLDQRITAYTKTFAWAKKLTYFAVRAIEHDFQTSTGFIDDVLTASNPYELKSILQDLDQSYTFDSRVCGQQPDSGRAVVRLTDLMGIPAGTLRDYLATDRAVIRDSQGVARWRGVRFSLSPVSMTGLSGRSSERVWGITGSVQVDGEFAASDVAFSLYKRATFLSRWCGAPIPGQDPEYQVGMHRPAHDVYPSSPDGMGGFSDALQMQPSTIQNLKNLSDADFRVNEYPTATSFQFAGEGLYGDYILMFPTSGPDAIDLGHVEDVVLRFDYVFVNAITTQPSN